MADTVKIEVTCTAHDAPLSEDSDTPALNMESGQVTLDFEDCWCENAPEEGDPGCEFVIKTVVS